MKTTHPIDRLFETIASRKGSDPAKSYTALLLKEGPAKCAKKFGEEAVEVVLAAVAKDKKSLAAESADVLYHLLVVWAACGVTPAGGVRRAQGARRPVGPCRESCSRKKESADYSAGSSAICLTRSSTRLRSLGSLIFMKARLS